MAKERISPHEMTAGQYEELLHILLRAGRQALSPTAQQWIDDKEVGALANAISVGPFLLQKALEQLRPTGKDLAYHRALLFKMLSALNDKELEKKVKPDQRYFFGQSIDQLLETLRVLGVPCVNALQGSRAQSGATPIGWSPITAPYAIGCLKQTYGPHYLVPIEGKMPIKDMNMVRAEYASAESILELFVYIAIEAFIRGKNPAQGIQMFLHHQLGATAIEHKDPGQSYFAILCSNIVYESLQLTNTRTKGWVDIHVTLRPNYPEVTISSDRSLYAHAGWVAQPAKAAQE